jgi:hypothetical protein
MSHDGKGILGNREATGEEIRQAMGHAIYAALREHKRVGIPAATWRNGRVVLVPPEAIVIPAEEEDDDDGPADASRNES